MNQILKKLAGETAVYGLSTILARILNFFFLPLYTRVMPTAGFGEVTEFMSYIAILQVILALGMESGYFNFASKEKNPSAVFSNAIISVGAISIISFITLSFASVSLAEAMGYAGNERVFIYIGAILAMDSISAIFYARLRYESKVTKFALFKSIKILSELSFNLILFLLVPSYLLTHPNSALLSFISPNPDFTYVIFAILLSGVVGFLLFTPEILAIKIRIDKPLLKKMLVYSIPLMFASLPGILNEFTDRILFRFFTPENLVWKSELGLFGAGMRLAVIMSLFIQMFRYSAEPFFFKINEKSDAKSSYAFVMNHFVAFGVLIFLGVVLFSDLIGLILGPDFRKGLDILPLMLIAYLFLGISVNINMWYKLQGKTWYGIPVTLAGFSVTLIINILFMPHYSYKAAAWAHLISYLTMIAVSLYFGNKHYPIKYNWGKMIFYISSGLLIYAVSLWLPDFNLVIKYSINTILIFIYLLLWRLKS